MAWTWHRERPPKEVAMRHSTRIVALSALLLLPGVATAKGRPGPITCPTDIPSALAEQCPCAGKMLPDASVAPWRNHGQYVSCVVHLRNALRKGGCLTADARRTLARCAARSSCGKGTAVLCGTIETGTCSDPAPGAGERSCGQIGELSTPDLASPRTRRFTRAQAGSRSHRQGGGAP